MHLEPITADDFVIDEDASYAISILKEYLKNNKISL